jgi:hypothetical protein
MRIGEALAVTWDAVNLDAKTVEELRREQPVFPRPNLAASMKDNSRRSCDELLKLPLLTPRVYAPQ